MLYIRNAIAAFFAWLYGVALPTAMVFFCIAGTIAKCFCLCWGGWKLRVYYKEDPPARRF